MSIEGIRVRYADILTLLSMFKGTVNMNLSFKKSVFKKSSLWRSRILGHTHLNELHMLSLLILYLLTQQYTVGGWAQLYNLYKFLSVETQLYFFYNSVGLTEKHQPYKILQVGD